MDYPKHFEQLKLNWYNKKSNFLQAEFDFEMESANSLTITIDKKYVDNLSKVKREYEKAGREYYGFIDYLKENPQIAIKI